MLGEDEIDLNPDFEDDDNFSKAAEKATDHNNSSDGADKMGEDAPDQGDK